MDEENGNVEGLVYRCKICGKQWDEDGCSVSVVSSICYEVDDFVCENCKEV